MTLTSPGGHELRHLEGRPEDIHTRGAYLVEVGESMKTTATMLTKISQGTAQIAESVDKIREIAGDIDQDLRAAGVRYEMTGDTLKTYATALSAAQNVIDPIIDDIEQAHADLEAARDARDDAEGELNGLNRVWVWEEEPTEAELTAARGELSSARTAVTGKETALNELWTTFDQAFGEWETAYEEAVKGVQSAMDTADNNDGGWEILDNVLDVAGWVVIGLGLLALVITGPIGLVITALAVALSAAILVAQIVKVANGRGSWTDVAVAAIGLLTFGAGGALTRLAGKGAPAVSTLISSGRGVVYQSVRATLPRFSLLHPFRSIGAWWTARSITNAGTKIPLLQNPLNAIRFGDEFGQYATFLGRVEKNFSHFPAVTQWLTNTGRAALPGSGYQVGFTGLWGGGLGIDLSNNFGAFDGLKDAEKGY